MHSLTHSFIHKHSFIHSFIIQITYMLGSNCEPLQCTYVQVGPQMNVNNLAHFSFHLTFCGQHMYTLDLNIHNVIAVHIAGLVTKERRITQSY